MSISDKIITIEVLHYKFTIAGSSPKPRSEVRVHKNNTKNNSSLK